VTRRKMYGQAGVSVWLVVLLPSPSLEHGRMMEPPSRASAWRVGFPTPRNEDDNALYCGGYGVQYDMNGGRCGICGDPWNQFPRDHEAPGGMYATGIITKTYKKGSIIPVVIDLTANHQGYFEFRLCPNNDIWEDPEQSCFDRFRLKTGKTGGLKYPIYDYSTGLRMLYVRLPRSLECEQCILQWTYTAGNNWGKCANGTGAVGCGPQETFRACSDIRIEGTGGGDNEDNTLASGGSAFSEDTEFEVLEFEEYYDDLFGEGERNNINYNQFQNTIRDYEDDEVYRLSTKKLALLKRKLQLSAALKTLHALILQSKEASANSEEDRRRGIGNRGGGGVGGSDVGSGDNDRGNDDGGWATTTRYPSTPRYQYSTEGSVRVTSGSRGAPYTPVESVTRGAYNSVTRGPYNSVTRGPYNSVTREAYKSVEALRSTSRPRRRGGEEGSGLTGGGVGVTTVLPWWSRTNSHGRRRRRRKVPAIAFY